MIRAVLREVCRGAAEQPIRRRSFLEAAADCQIDTAAQRFYGVASPRRFAIIIIGQIAVRGRH
jgi:hypothetical protein